MNGLLKVYKKSKKLVVFAIFLIIFAIAWIFFEMKYVSASKNEDKYGPTNSTEIFRTMTDASMSATILFSVIFLVFTILTIFDWFQSKEKENSKYSIISILVILNLFIPFISFILFSVTKKKLKLDFPELVRNKTNSESLQNN